MTRSHFVTLAEQYLVLRRSLGFALVTQGRLLVDFAHFAEEEVERGPLTVDLALRWAESSKRCRPPNTARHLSIVRGFARYCAGFDPATQVPPAGLFAGATRRRQQPQGPFS